MIIILDLAMKLYLIDCSYEYVNNESRDKKERQSEICILSICICICEDVFDIHSIHFSGNLGMKA